MSKIEYRFPKNPPNKIQLICEERGGYDEWSDRYYQVIGIEFPSGRELKPTKIKDEFVDTSGHELVVEFPSRKNNSIVIERYDPGYSFADVSSISSFNKHMCGKKDGKFVIEYNKLRGNNC